MVNAVGGEGAHQQHKDGKGAELVDHVVKEYHHYVVELLHQLAQGSGLFLAQGVHGQAQAHRQEHHGQHSRVAAEGGDDVGGHHIQNHVHGIGAGGAGVTRQPLHMGGKETRVIQRAAGAAGQHQRKKRTDQKPDEGFGGNAP